MYNDFDNAFRALWRQCRGNKDEAYKTIKATAVHFGFTPTDFDIDIALGEMNNGYEIEWLS